MEFEEQILRLLEQAHRRYNNSIEMETELIKEILHKEAEAVMNIPVTDGFGRAVDILYEHVHKRGGKIIMSGMGKAGQIAVNMSTTFCSTGSPAIFLHPAEAQHGDLGVIQPV